MNWVNSLLGSNIGRKLVMALTGLFLISFLFVHLSGNFLLLSNDSGAKFNAYSRFMSTAGIIRVLEIVLVAGFLIHIYTAVVLTRKNASRRPGGYAAGNKTPGVSWFSKNMGLTGSLILVFLILHLRTFYFEYHYGTIRQVYYQEQSQGEMAAKVKMTVLEEGQMPPSGVDVYKDMAFIAHEAFQSPLYIIAYTIAFILLGAHLIHGFQSAFQTLGFEHKKYSPLISALSWIIGVGVPLGFTIIPVLMKLSNPLYTNQ